LPTVSSDFSSKIPLKWPAVPFKAVNEAAMARIMAFLLLTLTTYRVGASENQANPIRRVVSLLQGLAEKISKEGEAEKQLFEEFMCHCKKRSQELAQSIAENSDKVPAAQSDIEEAQSQVKKFKLELAQHEADQKGVSQSMQAASQEHETVDREDSQEMTELKNYLASLDNAIKSIESGNEGLFLQSSARDTLLDALGNILPLEDFNRNAITAFLTGSGMYVPRSSEALGILKQMKAEVEKNLAELRAQEAEQEKSAVQATVAKGKQEKTLKVSIGRERAKIAELGISIVNMKGDAMASERALIADQNLASQLEKSCAAKEEEFQVRTKTRGEELMAIQDTIKLLNDDDALDLFKRTLPSPSSLLQLRTSGRRHRNRALTILRELPKGVSSPEISLLTYTISSGTADFGKVFKMIESMTKLMAQEQEDDDAKVEYCKKRIDIAEDKLKDQARKLSNIDALIAEQEELSSTVLAEIESLTAGIRKLDEQVAEAEQQRKKENQEFTDLMSSDRAAKELLEVAKNRLQKFYNPRLYKPPKKVLLRQLDTGDLPLISSKDSASFLQVEAHHPAALVLAAYRTKLKETSAVISMLERLSTDLGHEMHLAELDEEQSQKDYETMLKDAADKRMATVNALTHKQGVKAQTEETLVAQRAARKVEASEQQAMDAFKMDLHADCDWTMNNYDIRKAARQQETAALGDAKATLAGADLSLAQRLRGKRAAGKPAIGLLRGPL